MSRSGETPAPVQGDSARLGTNAYFENPPTARELVVNRVKAPAMTHPYREFEAKAVRMFAQAVGDDKTVSVGFEHSESMNKKARKRRARLRMQLETCCGGPGLPALRDQRLTTRLLTAGTNASAEAHFWFDPSAAGAISMRVVAGYSVRRRCASRGRRSPVLADARSNSWVRVAPSSECRRAGAPALIGQL